MSGTTDAFQPRSTPILRCLEVDIVSLLFGQNVDLEDAELRALRSNAAQQSEETSCARA